MTIVPSKRDVVKRATRGLFGGLALGTFLVGAGVLRSIATHRTPAFLWKQPASVAVYLLAFTFAGLLVGLFVRPSTNRVDTLAVCGLAGATCLTIVGWLGRTSTSGRGFHFVVVPAVGALLGVLLGRSWLAKRESAPAHLHSNER